MVPNERWQLMSKLVQLTDMHFPDLNPNSYDNLNNMKLDYKCLHKVSQFQCKLVSQIRVITSFFQVFCSVFFKGHWARHLQNGICCIWAGLFIFLASHLPTILTVLTLLIYSRSYQMLEHVYMKPEVKSNWFEISLWGKVSLRCEVTSLSAVAWLKAGVKLTSMQISLQSNWPK